MVGCFNVFCSLFFFQEYIHTYIHDFFLRVFNVPDLSVTASSATSL